MINSYDTTLEQIAEDFGPIYYDKFMDQLEKSMCAMEGFEEFLDEFSDRPDTDYFYVPVDNISVAIH